MKAVFIYFMLLLIITPIHGCKPRRGGGSSLSSATATGESKNEIDLVYVNQFVLPLYQTAGILSTLNDKHPHLQKTIQILKKTTSPVVRAATATALLSILKTQGNAINWKTWFNNYSSPKYLADYIIEKWVNPSIATAYASNPQCQGYKFKSCSSHEECEYNLAAIARTIEVDARQNAIVKKVTELQQDVQCLEDGVSKNILTFKLEATKLWQRFYSVTDYQVSRETATYPTGDPQQIAALQEAITQLTNQYYRYLKVQDSAHYFKMDVIKKIFHERFYHPAGSAGWSFAQLMRSLLNEGEDVQIVLIDRLKYYLQKTDQTFDGLKKLLFLSSRINQINISPWLGCIRKRMDHWVRSYNRNDPYRVISPNDADASCPALSLTPKQTFQILAGSLSPDNSGMTYVLRELKGAWRDEYIDTMMHALASLQDTTGDAELYQATELQNTKERIKKSILDFFKMSHVSTALFNKEKTIAQHVAGFSSWQKQIEDTNKIVKVQNEIAQAKQSIAQDKKASGSERRAAYKQLDEAQRLLSGTSLKYYCYDYLFNTPGQRSRQLVNITGQEPVQDNLRLSGRCWLGWLLKLDTEKIVRGLSSVNPVTATASIFGAQRLGHDFATDKLVDGAHYFFKYYGLDSINTKKDPFQEVCLGEYGSQGGFIPPDKDNMVPLEKVCRLTDSKNTIANSQSLDRRLGCWIKAQQGYEKCVEWSAAVEMEVISTAIMFGSGALAFRGIAWLGQAMMRGRQVKTIGEKLARAGFKMRDAFTNPKALAILLKEAAKHSPTWAIRSISIGAAFSILNKLAMKAFINVPLYDPQRGLRKNLLGLAQEIGVGAIFMGIMPGFDRITSKLTSKLLSRMPQSSRVFQKKIAFWAPGGAEFALDVALETYIMQPLWRYFDEDDQMWMQEDQIIWQALKNTFVFRAASARVDVKHILNDAVAIRAVQRRKAAELFDHHQNLLGRKNLLLDLGVTKNIDPSKISVNDINVWYQKMLDQFYVSGQRAHAEGMPARTIAKNQLLVDKAREAHNQLRDPERLQEFLTAYQRGNIEGVTAETQFDHAD